MIYHILIVDDEAAIKKGLSMLIQKALPNCVIDGTASDGAEAIALIQKSAPDIVITDIKMPVCNGLELSKFLFENYPDIKIIMLTGFADFAYAQTAIQYRVSEYLLKPTSKEKLVGAITKIQAEISELRKNRGFLKKNSAVFLERALNEVAFGSVSDEYISTIASCWPAAQTIYYCISFQSKTQDAPGKSNITLIRNILEQQLQTSFIYRYGSAINCLYFADNKNDALSFAQDTANLCNLLYGVTVSAGVSCEKSQLNEIPDASKEALSALTSNFFTGSHVGVFESSKNDIAHQAAPIYRTDLYTLEKALEDLDFSASRKIIDDVFDSFRPNHISSSQVKYVTGQIYYILTRIILQNSLPEGKTEFLNLLDRSSDAEILKEYLLEMLRNIEQSLKQARKHTNQLIRNATNYISGHLAEALSLEVIADAVNVNPSYLSRIFSKECGETITEYITRVRIEKAKELLRLSNHYIYQVSEATGFNDPAYFSTIFKKYTGFSPKEYKNKYDKK